MAAAKLREARIMRELYRNQMIETYDVTESLKSQTGLRNLFARRAARLDEIVGGFKQHHQEVIKAVKDEELEAEEAIRKEFDRMFYHVEDIYYTLFPSQTSTSVSPSPNIGASTLQNIRLPKIPLRTFSGNFADWCPFYQSFKSAIHDNKQLADIDKFQYLLSCLSGEPLNTIKSLTLCEANYPIAYQTLIDRYDNKRELASHYWNEIKATTKLTSESANALRRLLDRFKENRSALKALKLADDLEDFLWFSMLLDRLDSESRRLFESEHRSQKNSVPTFATLSDFVEGQCRVLEAVGVVREPPSRQSRPLIYAHGPNFHPKAHAKTLIAGATTPVDPVSNLRCSLCGQSHHLRKCQTFLSKPASERFHTVKEARLCYNCLSPGHSSGTCPSAFSCKECQARHHSLLHFKKARQAPSTGGKPAPSPEPQVDAYLVTSCTGGFSPNPNRNNVLLATASINIVDKWGNTHKTRALLDTGSQASFIVSSRANQLELPRSQNSLSIFGLGHTPAKPSVGTARCEILPRHGKGPAAVVDLVVLPQICGPLPNSPIDPSKADHVNDLDLADPEWYKPAPIDILLGSDVLQSVLRDGVISGDSARPMALRTVFGWVLIGPVAATESPVQTLLTCMESPLDCTLRDFWQLEEVPSKPVVAPEHQQAEAIFVKSVYRDSSGRFGVALPFKAADLPVFENSRIVADRRWLALERRLRGQPDLKRLYEEFMKDYLASGHMSLLTAEPPGSECYFIPHHCVVRSDKGEVKIRVVFDASAKALNQVALNDELLIGPKLQNDIFTILLNFRSKPIVFTADIRQMYRQINIVPEHRRYQLIRYRFSESDPVQTYQLNTVTYGVSSAPYLAIRTLLHLAEIGEKQYPLAAQAIRKSTYVDDLVCAVDSEQCAVELKAQLIELFAIGRFELRKWTSNRPALLQDLPESHCQGHPSTFEGSGDFSTKILGLQWHAGSDSFSFEVQPNKQSLCTKRSMLSEVARIFDPLGFLAPLSFLVKHLIQHLWTLGLDWDEAPPEETCRLWRLLKGSLCNLVRLKIPRPLFEASPKECQLHAFCDASQRGYACVIYLRYLVGVTPKVVLLTAKSKVAPLKCLSIPRLELCAAVLLAKLVAIVVDAMKD